MVRIIYAGSVHATTRENAFTKNYSVAGASSSAGASTGVSAGTSVAAGASSTAGATTVSESSMVVSLSDNASGADRGFHTPVPAQVVQTSFLFGVNPLVQSGHIHYFY